MESESQIFPFLSKLIYVSAVPPSAHFPYCKSCLDFQDFIGATIIDSAENGSLLVWAKVVLVGPPFLVMLILTVEPTKPRMCQDECFLNLLWIRDLPLSLDH